MTSLLEIRDSLTMDIYNTYDSVHIKPHFRRQAIFNPTLLSHAEHDAPQTGTSGHGAGKLILYTEHGSSSWDGGHGGGGGEGAGSSH